MFTAELEDAFKLLERKGFFVNIVYGAYITHIRFADDIVVTAESLKDLSTMLGDLDGVSQRVGFKMDMTKIMSNIHVVLELY
ncbi:unnamed protein product [Euphydryas editha]|uniref:Reverse transcriptase domain-containing protein n=1 Tax=Euphydryas editha TaxID=104508 RepID=A0AAU9UH97_EUPED|nr:unnamed protein product [Euphydryas editha]